MKKNFLFLAFAVVLISGCGGSGGSSNSQPAITVWGGAEAGTTDGAASVATFDNPANVVTDSSGNAYVSDYDSSRIRKIDRSGNVTTLVDQANFNAPFGLAMSPSGVLYVQTDTDDKGNKDATTGTIWQVDTVKGGATLILDDVGGRPRGIHVLSNGLILMSDLTRNTIKTLNPTTKQIVTIAGADGVAGFTNGTGTAARFNRPYGIDVLSDGSYLVADQSNNCLRRVTSAGVVSTYAGTGTAGATNGAIGSSTFNGPQGVAVAPDGSIYVADTVGHFVRRIKNGLVYSQEGNGIAGYESGTGQSAEFYGLEGLALDKSGHLLWVTDGNEGDGSDHNRVRLFKVP